MVLVKDLPKKLYLLYLYVLEDVLKAWLNSTKQ
jgi:hypothetical protein